jgi:T5SS/PEP-CTERM-associated repeat protein
MPVLKPGAPRLRAGTPVSVPAALLALLAALPLPGAATTFFEASGAVYSTPANLVPGLVSTSPVFNLQGNTLYVGDGQPGGPYLGPSGRFSVLAGGQVSNADLVVVGTGYAGQLLVSGAGSALRFLPGSLNVGLFVSSLSPGLVQVLDGGLIDAVPTNSACISGWCGSTLGAVAGSDATLTVSGAGSEVRLGRVQVAVDQVVSAFGNAGRNSQATINVLAGATLRTTKVNLARSVVNGPDAWGSEQSFASVTIDGAGSRWIASRDPLAQDDFYFHIGEGSHASATVTVSHGGQFLIDTSAAAAGVRSSLKIGDTGSHGTLNVSTGGAVTMTGPETVIVVGSDIGSSGSFSIDSGGQGRAGSMQVGGGPAASGQFTVSGAGSVLQLSGAASGLLFAGLEGQGSIQVLDGGLIDATSQLVSCAPTQLILTRCYSALGVLAGAGGTLTVSGAGSEVRLATLAAGGTYVDNSDPGYGGVVGGTGRGTINVLAGGRLTTMETTLGLDLAGPGSTGSERAEASALVSGAGSLWRIQPNALNGMAAQLTLGSGVHGHGSLTLQSGGQLLIDGGAAAAVMRLGSNFGSGEALLDGGSALRLTGAGSAELSIGHSGTGAMTLNGASTLEVAGTVYVGRNTGSSGQLTLSDHSTLTATRVAVAANAPGADGGFGSLTLDNSTLTAATLEIGRFGVVNGDGGLIVGQVINRGTLNPDPPGVPGTLTIAGDLVNLPGSHLVLDIAADGHGGFKTSRLVFTPGSSVDFSGAAVRFNFLGDTDPNAFLASGAFVLDSFLRSGAWGGLDQGLSTTFANGTGYGSLFASGQFSATSSAWDIRDFVFTPDGSAAFSAMPVPEPGAATLLLAGALLLAWRVRGALGARAQAASAV